MIQSHLVALLVFSGLVAFVFAQLLRDPGERWRFGLKVFLAFVGSTLAIGWLLFWLQG